jgi:hypothetical protein
VTASGIEPTQTKTTATNCGMDSLHEWTTLSSEVVLWMLRYSDDAKVTFGLYSQCATSIVVRRYEKPRLRSHAI